jgi:PIN domain
MSPSTKESGQLIIADTCSILDIARSAWRKESLSADVGAVQRLQNAAREPARLVIAICDVTVGEFKNHIDEVEMEGRNALANLRKRVAHADEVAGHLGVARLADSSIGWDERILKSAVMLAREVSDRALVIEASEDETNRAYRRATAGRAPGRRGSHNMFDCVIAECAIRVAKRRTSGTTYLLTSNSKDFGGENGERLHADLEVEFRAAGLAFATNWSEVAGRTGLG